AKHGKHGAAARCLPALAGDAVQITDRQDAQQQFRVNRGSGVRPRFEHANPPIYESHLASLCRCQPRPRVKFWDAFYPIPSLSFTNSNGTNLTISQVWVSGSEFQLSGLGPKPAVR